MRKSVRFTKMHGAGNDYIYVDTQKYDVPDPSAAAIAWSNRHTGIGSDGLVLIGKPYGGVDADFSMRIVNADGSEAKLCGTASRCIAKYLRAPTHRQDNYTPADTLGRKDSDVASRRWRKRWRRFGQYT